MHIRQQTVVKECGKSITTESTLTISVITSYHIVNCGMLEATGKPYDKKPTTDVLPNGRKKSRVHQ